MHYHELCTDHVQAYGRNRGLKSWHRTDNTRRPASSVWHCTITQLAKRMNGKIQLTQTVSVPGSYRDQMCICTQQIFAPLCRRHRVLPARACFPPGCMHWGLSMWTPTCRVCGKCANKLHHHGARHACTALAGAVVEQPHRYSTYAWHFQVAQVRCHPHGWLICG